MPVPLRGMLETLASSSASQAAGVVRSNTGAQLSAGVGDFCRKAIAGRYPFTRTATADVGLDDFAELFAPGGLMDDFFQKNLVQLVDTSTKPWTFKKNIDGSAAGGSASLAAFQNAAAIRDAYFRAGSRTPQYHVSIRTIELDPSIQEVKLEVGGEPPLTQTKGGADRSFPFSWPPPDGQNQVRLQVTPAAPNTPPSLAFDGPWALNRLIEQAKITPGATPERFNAALNVGGRNVTLEVVAGSVQNPFRLRELSNFSCPGRL